MERSKSELQAKYNEINAIKLKLDKDCVELQSALAWERNAKSDMDGRAKEVESKCFLEMLLPFS